MHGCVAVAMLGAGLRSTVRKAARVLLRRSRRLLRLPSPGDRAQWSELPPELLVLVFSRVPSHADRVRLRAVCRPWRRAARLQPLPPPLPWLVLHDDTFLTLPDCAAHRMSLGCNKILFPAGTLDDDTLITLPGSAPRGRSLTSCNKEIVFRVSTGSKLFIAHRDGSCHLVDPSSGETTPLHINLGDLPIDLNCHLSSRITKVVVSDHIVALLVMGRLKIITRRQFQGARPCSYREWTPPENAQAAVDMALFQGELYVLTTECHIHYGSQPPEMLHLLDIGDEQNPIRSVQCLRRPRETNNPYCAFLFYLVVSGDRLLVVERLVNMLHYCITDRPRHSGIWIKVSEAVDLIAGHGRWSKVDTLAGRALFVSRDCSESLSAQCGARDGCIYFMTDRSRLPTCEKENLGADLMDCIVYNVRDKTIEPLTLATEGATDGPFHPTWLFPADV